MRERLSAGVSRATARAAARQVASRVLTYPDDRLLDELGLLRSAVEAPGMLPDGTREPLAQVLEHIRATPLGEQQRQYVATFDLRKRCCLYLTWWAHGDTRNRGYALVGFKQAYRNAGMEPPRNELPDHLAVVLEFAAAGDPEAGEALLCEHRPGLELLRQALHKAASPYAGAVDAVCATLPHASADVAAAAQRIAAAGPPAELVGLEGAGPQPIQLQPYDPHRRGSEPFGTNLDGAVSR
ncbi:nitrate reductase molybdenum cofactor assembly chaperone [Phytoactinopolyspora halotolerans]|uniref:Nitrate reductase molybdenum cofactor assembly chaperone n=1 Tax=Phytoactinopolyspora halotolerans TaxID=1981512 RepID=A0A6L9S7X5_9ACTN|nr:nitrate reductase molybdenum cofactor assembly chaperone [Phytoactinopolyspora halotolerans]NEE00628.1 nitrate reductase molybdenum cofactor assembly chaperone [Phytoactinopolyspora halotolerans]